ncbi:MAG: rhodanese-like domain-containing protein [Usitatibacter sp.]
MKRALSMLFILAAGHVAAAPPQVSGDGACGIRSNDNEAFITCDGERAPAPAGPNVTVVDGADAWRMANDLGERALIVDVRERPGDRPRVFGVDAHVPLLTASEKTAASFNLEFLRAVDAALAAKGLDHEDPVFLLCRDGSVSRLAAELMALHGYRQLVVFAGGAEGAAPELASAP